MFSSTPLKHVSLWPKLTTSGIFSTNIRLVFEKKTKLFTDLNGINVKKLGITLSLDSLRRVSMKIRLISEFLTLDSSSLCLLERFESPGVVVLRGFFPFCTLNLIK